jgi:hypothetical protein
MMWARPAATRLYQKFKSANTDYHVSFAAPPVIAAEDRYGHTWYDWRTIVDNVDAIVPMLYTANPPQMGWTTNAQPLAGGKPTDRTVPRDVVTQFYAAMPEQKSKLLLGVNSFPWSGYEFECESAGRLTTSIGRAKTHPFEYMEQQAARYGKR